MTRLVFVILTAAGCWAQTAAEALERKTQQALEELAARSPGVVGVAVIDLEKSRSFQVNGDVVFAQASVIKIPIMMRAFAAVEEKRLRLDAPVTLTAADKVGGSGTIQKQLEPGPVTLSVRELLRAMIEASDNTATNKVIALLGMDSINASIQRLGLKETRLQRVMMDAAAARAGRENLSTPMELARLLEKIYRREAARSAEMIEILKLVRGDIRKNIPAPIPVAAKTGELTGVANEAAIVFLERRPYILSVMTVFQPEGTSVIPEVTKLVHGYFQSLAASNAYGNRVFE